MSSAWAVRIRVAHMVLPVRGSASFTLICQSRPSYLIACHMNPSLRHPQQPCTKHHSTDSIGTLVSCAHACMQDIGVMRGTHPQPSSCARRASIAPPLPCTACPGPDCGGVAGRIPLGDVCAAMIALAPCARICGVALDTRRMTPRVLLGRPSQERSARKGNSRLPARPPKDEQAMA